MSNGVRVRTLFLSGCFASAILAAGAAYLAVGGAIERRLAAPGPGDATAAVVEAARGSIVAVTLGAIVVAAILGVVLAGVLARSLAGLRVAIDRIGADGAPTRVPSSPVVELNALAAAIDRLADEHQRRIAPLARERNELALLVDSVGEGIIQAGPQGRVVRMNQTARVMLNLPGEVTGQPIASLIRNPELRGMLEAVTAGRAVAPTEVTIDDRRILVAARPIGADDGSGGRLGSVSIFVDLTELRRLEGVRRDFVANASHELKTPLTSIRGYTETLLTDDLPDETRQRFLETVHQNAERLQRIVDDLLDLSRLESGRWRPDLAELEIAEAAEDAWRALADKVASRGIEFRVVTEGRTAALADPIGVRQIFANLFDNAIRYIPARGRITVRVIGPATDTGAGPAGSPTETGDPRSTGRPAAPAPARSGATGARMPAPAVPLITPATRNGEYARQADGDDWVTVAVQDTGIGIPRDALTRVFERFYRIDPARSRAEGGTGLGLAIVKHLVESMGGDVVAESELGKGTTIRFRLPTAYARGLDPVPDA